MSIQTLYRIADRQLARIPFGLAVRVLRHSTWLAAHLADPKRSAR